MGCLNAGAQSSNNIKMNDMDIDQHSKSAIDQCRVLVTSKRFIDPDRPASRDIMFELIALPEPDSNSYAAVGFSETGRMQGLVSECLQHLDPKANIQMVYLKHSYNIPGTYQNVQVNVLSGIKDLGMSFKNGRYQCRWIVESAVEFSYEASNGSTITQREDLGYKNYHILLATGRYDPVEDGESILVRNAYNYFNCPLN